MTDVRYGVITEIFFPASAPPSVFSSVAVEPAVVVSAAVVVVSVTAVFSSASVEHPISRIPARAAAAARLMMVFIFLIIISSSFLSTASCGNQ